MQERKTNMKTRMERMEQFFADFFPSLLKIHPFLLGALITITFLSQNTERHSSWAKSGVPFSSDIDQYYSYLPQIIIHKDPAFRNAERYWTTTLPNGNKIQRFTIGVAVMELPFFLVGHKLAKWYDYPEDGYSPPYGWALYYGAVMYVLLGLFFSYLLLRHFFSRWYSASMVFLLFFATNLFYYSVAEALMSHSFLFFLQSGFLYFLYRWLKGGGRKFLLSAAFFGAMAVLIRPTEILIFIFPLLLGVFDKASFTNRLIFFRTHIKDIIFASLIFVLVLIPQVGYWKYVTGNWVYYSYGDEGFFFSDPKWVSFLFGYRKGLIPYSPILIFSLLGFIVLWFKKRDLFWSIFIFFLLNTYLLSCWWDYGFGGGLGNRALVQSYSSLILPQAFFFHWLVHLFRSTNLQRLCYGLFVLLASGFIHLNLMMVKQYKETIIHWVGMNKETYWFVFGKEKFTSEDFITREKLITIPDFEKMKNGQRNQ